MDAFFCFHAPEDANRYSLVADESAILKHVLVCARTQRVRSQPNLLTLAL